MRLRRVHPARHRHAKCRLWPQHNQASDVNNVFVSSKPVSFFGKTTIVSGKTSSLKVTSKTSDPDCASSKAMVKYTLLPAFPHKPKCKTNARRSPRSGQLAVLPLWPCGYLSLELHRAMRARRSNFYRSAREFESSPKYRADHLSVDGTSYRKVSLGQDPKAQIRAFLSNLIAVVEPSALISFPVGILRDHSPRIASPWTPTLPSFRTLAIC